MMGHQAKRKMMRPAFFLAACVGLHAMAQGVPPGAASLGCTLCVINEKPTASDIAPDSPGFERWMELDVDEGGFGPGLLGTVHSWSGIAPNYTNISGPNNYNIL
jgi:hypothetical protein